MYLIWIRNASYFNYQRKSGYTLQSFALSQAQGDKRIFAAIPFKKFKPVVGIKCFSPAL